MRSTCRFIPKNDCTKPYTIGVSIYCFIRKINTFNYFFFINIYTVNILFITYCRQPSEAAAEDIIAGQGKT